MKTRLHNPTYRWARRVHAKPFKVWLSSSPRPMRNALNGGHLFEGYREVAFALLEKERGRTEAHARADRFADFLATGAGRSRMEAEEVRAWCASDRGWDEARAVKAGAKARVTA